MNEIISFEALPHHSQQVHVVPDRRLRRSYHDSGRARTNFANPRKPAWECAPCGWFSGRRTIRTKSRGARRQLAECDSSPTYSGSGPRMSTLYFAATAMSFAISGGVKSLKGTLSSKTKRSNPAGAHSRSIRAGLAPTTLKP